MQPCQSPASEQSPLLPRHSKGVGACLGARWLLGAWLSQQIQEMEASMATSDRLGLT